MADFFRKACELGAGAARLGFRRILGVDDCNLFGNFPA